MQHMNLRKGIRKSLFSGKIRKMGGTFFLFLFLFQFFVLNSKVAAFDALQPSEVAVLAVKPDADSMRTAQFYMRARGIPEKNLLLLEKSYPADLPRDVWEKEVRPLISDWLAGRPDIRCLVCAWGLPLRIGVPSDDASRRNERLQYFTEQETVFCEKITEMMRSMLLTAPTEETRKQAESLPDLHGMDAAQFGPMLTEMLKNAKERVAALPENERKTAGAGLDKILLPALGLNGVQNVLILNMQQKQAQLKPESVLKIVQTVRALEDALAAVHFEADTKERDVKLMQTVQLLNGTLPALQLARGLKTQLERYEGRSSFDSELSLIYEKESYALTGWTPNMYAYSNGLPPRIKVQIKPKNTIPVPPGLLEHPDAPASSGTTEALPAPGDDTALAPPPFDFREKVMGVKNSETGDSSEKTDLGPQLDTDLESDAEKEKSAASDGSAGGTGVGEKNAVPLSEGDEEEEEEISMTVETSVAPALSEDTIPGDGFSVPVPKRRVLLVARLEGPSVETVLKRIEESLEVEKKGLKGTVYLDARTPRPVNAAVGSYAKMEQSLNDLGIRLERYTDLDVHLDTADAMFTKDAASAPCALYCGWYSVRNFQDIFTFCPGAVAYHVASFEAESLHSGPFWCPNLLEHGAAATLGPTFEPYLAAFPEPDEFYSLVLTGKFTMIECYYYAKPFNSWAMTYVGDPLYTPFRANPKLKMEELPNNLQRFFGIQP